MNIEEIREYCLTKKGSSECFPFDDVTLVFKVGGKMFALCNLDGDLSINLKCNPEKAVELRELYPAVKPGYHMNKKLWNTVEIDGSINDSIIKSWINDSYQLIVASLTKKQKEELSK
jgi:predicted DNA-binding protein (MmcQ/YjbR family)